MSTIISGQDGSIQQNDISKEDDDLSEVDLGEENDDVGLPAMNGNHDPSHNPVNESSANHVVPDVNKNISVPVKKAQSGEISS